MRFPFTGVIPVDKPKGVSSRRVVDAVAKALRMKAVGHAGTLDPLAEGVVVVLVGHATRLVEFVQELPKRYVGGFLLGRSSPSDDVETPIEMEIEPIVPTAADLARAVEAFTGDLLQRPCDYSAVHVGGKRAYELARKGRAVEIPPKPIRIDRLTMVEYDWPRLVLDVTCSSGTFIRGLGRDLAIHLGTRGLMESLSRESVGPFCRNSSLPLERAADAERALLPAAEAIPHLPRVILDEARLGRLARGMIEQVAEAEGRTAVAAIAPDGSLVGILRPHESGGHRLRPNFLGG